MLLVSGFGPPLCRQNVPLFFYQEAQSLFPQKATAVQLANVIKPLDGDPLMETNGAISGANPILIEILSLQVSLFLVIC
jgi:hypothetical protein